MMLETGLLQSANAVAMGLLNVPSATVLWDFLQTDLPNYTGDLIAQDRKSTRLNSSHIQKSRMPSSA